MVTHRPSVLHSQTTLRPIVAARHQPFFSRQRLGYLVQHRSIVPVNLATEIEHFEHIPTPSFVACLHRTRCPVCFPASVPCFQRGAHYRRGGFGNGRLEPPRSHRTVGVRRCRTTSVHISYALQVFSFFFFLLFSVSVRSLQERTTQASETNEPRHSDEWTHVDSNTPRRRAW